MAATLNQRFQTGDRCQNSGSFEFDGYMDGSTSPLPKPDEMQIAVKAGDEFPAVCETHKACYWRPVEREDDYEISGLKE
jgi:hypothetical protein